MPSKSVEYLLKQEALPSYRKKGILDKLFMFPIVIQGEILVNKLE
jgi:hypothetical protein